MKTRRLRSAAFFASCFALLLFGAVWVQFPDVRERIQDEGDIARFYVLIGFAICYLAGRAYLALGRHVPERWERAWLVLDLSIITYAVFLTGGIRSEAALVYFWPVATSSIQRRPRLTLSVGVSCAALYVAVAWLHGLEGSHLTKLVTYVFVMLVATGVAAAYAMAEAARVEEIARLREQVALGDYRTRLSQEMHDGIQHYLVRIATRLELARSIMGERPAQAAQVAVDQRVTVRQAADELRYLVRRLRSPSIERQGFVAALGDHLSFFEDRSSISARLEIEGEPTPLRPDIEQAVFRVVQEALTNAEKYSQASEVKVRLGFAPGRFECVVADNGVGFDPAEMRAEPAVEGGFGLSSMEQRAESVDGQLRVTSGPGRGTEVAVSVPIRAEDTTSRSVGVGGQHQAAHCRR